LLCLDDGDIGGAATGRRDSTQLAPAREAQLSAANAAAHTRDAAGLPRPSLRPPLQAVIYIDLLERYCANNSHDNLNLPAMHVFVRTTPHCSQCTTRRRRETRERESCGNTHGSTTVRVHDTSTCRCQEARMTGQCQGDPPEWRSAPDPGLCGVCDTVSCTRTVLCSHVCSHVCSHRERARAAARQYASTSASVHSIGETTSRGCAARSGKPCFGANGGGALCWANKLLIP